MYEESMVLIMQPYTAKFIKDQYSLIIPPSEKPLAYVGTNNHLILKIRKHFFKLYSKNIATSDKRIDLITTLPCPYHQALRTVGFFKRKAPSTTLAKNIQDTSIQFQAVC